MGDTMYGIWGYTDDEPPQYLGHWDSYVNAIAAAGSLMDTGRYANVTVEIDIGADVDPRYEAISTA
jgi:hypothetical protein